MADNATQTEPDDIDESKMPLIEHLTELRQRLMYSVGAVLVLFFISYAFAEDIYQFLLRPLADAYAERGIERRVIYTALYEVFFTYIKVAFFTAIFIAFPVIAIQLWKFIAPGLYKHEKSAFMPFLIVTPLLFFAGGAMVYYFVMPVAIDFFIDFEVGQMQNGVPIELEPKVNEYMSLVMRLIFAFGLCFELPVIMTLLARIGITSSSGMRAKRKYAIVCAFIAAAVLTPPDPISQIGLALPTILLYEISIFSVIMVERSRRERLREQGYDEDEIDDVDDDNDEDESETAVDDEAASSEDGDADSAKPKTD